MAQSYSRKLHCRLQYLLLQSLIKVAQARWRCALARQTWSRLLTATKIVQCAFRCHRAKSIREQKLAMVAAAEAKKEELLTAVEIVQVNYNNCKNIFL